MRANKLSDQLEYKEQHLQLAMDTVGELDWYIHQVKELQDEVEKLKI